MDWENDMQGVVAGPSVNNGMPTLSNVQFETQAAAPSEPNPSLEAFLNPSLNM